MNMNMNVSVNVKSKQSRSTGVWCLGLALVLGSVSCAKKDDQASSTDPDTAMLLAAVSVISGGATAESTAQSVSMLPELKTDVDSLHRPSARSSFWAAVISGASVPQAIAAVTSCTQGAANDTCSSGLRSATYTNCSIGGTGLTFSGSVALTYSSASCAMAVNGQTVSRTVNLARETVAGGQVAVSSSSHSDYRGNTISGGTTITKTVGGYTMAVNGMRYHRTTASGVDVYDISTRTTSPCTVAFPTASTVTVTGGSLEVIHNLARYTTTVTASNLGYAPASCCYPTSGTLQVSYSGGVTGTMSFSGTCGDVSLTVNGSSRAVTLASCQ